MEASKQPRGVYKGHYVDSRSQRNRLRFQTIDEALEYEDSLEPSVRYVDSVKTARAEQRERALAGKLGRSSRGKKGAVAEDLGVDE